MMKRESSVRSQRCKSRPKRKQPSKATSTDYRAIQKQIEKRQSEIMTRQLEIEGLQKDLLARKSLSISVSNGKRKETKLS